AHGSVVGPRDGMADPGIDAVESVSCRNFEVAFDRARLATQLQQAVLLAAGARHLVHDPRGCAYDVVFDALTQRREVSRVDAMARGSGDGDCNRDFQRGRRRDASAFRYGGVDQNPQASRRRSGRKQRLHDANDVARPTIGLSFAKPSGELLRRGEGQLYREEIPATSPQTCDLTARRCLRLYERKRRAVERQLEHARAAVVGDSAHHIEAARCAHDAHGSLGGKETAQARIRRGGQRLQQVERGLEPIHSRSPRRRSAACSTGSTTARNLSFAYPTHATSVFKSSGASTAAPEGSVMITPASTAISAVHRS